MLEQTDGTGEGSSADTVVHFAVVDRRVGQHVRYAHCSSSHICSSLI